MDALKADSEQGVAPLLKKGSTRGLVGKKPVPRQCVAAVVRVNSELHLKEDKGIVPAQGHDIVESLRNFIVI